MADSASEFAMHAEGVARALLGEPSRNHSHPGRELRWGSNGALSLKLATGGFYDHEAEKGGGVLWLIERERGLKGRDAVAWMNENGFPITDREPVRAPSHADTRASAPVRKTGEDWSFLGGVPPEGRLVATFDYVDGEGELRYQVCRFEWPAPEKPKGYEKTFRQRRPDSTKSSGWSWKVRDQVVPLPYQLPDLVEAVASGATVFIAEGEKAVDVLRANGMPATCNSGGAGKWPPEIVEWFRGANVVVLPDNDAQGRNKAGEALFHHDGTPKLAGQDHAGEVAARLAGVAAAVRVLEIPGLPLKGDVADWFAAGGTADALYEIVEANAVAGDAYVPSASYVAANPDLAPKPGEFRSRLGLVLWRDLGRATPAHDWVVKRWLKVGEVSVFAGASQGGKTFAVVDLAMSVARGNPFLGRYRTKPGLVVYQAGEGAKGLLAQRIPAYRQANGLTWADDLPFAVLGKPLDLMHGDEDADAFIADVKALSEATGLRSMLNIIDTVAAASPGADENSSKDVGPMLARCYRIARETGGAVILVAHLNAGGNKVRGWTGFHANVDTVITCTKLDDASDNYGREIRELQITKQKDGEGGLRERFVLVEHEIGRDYDGDPITSCTIGRPNAAGTAADAALPEPEPAAGSARLSGYPLAYLEALAEAVHDHGEIAPIEIGLPTGRRVVHRDHVAAAFDPRWSGDAKDPVSARRGARRDAGRRLLDLGLIGNSGSLFWLTGRIPTGLTPASHALLTLAIGGAPAPAKEEPDPLAEWGQL